jgi:hypothetical protein
MTPSDLGWMPFVQTWIATQLPEEAPVTVKTHLFSLFDKAGQLRSTCTHLSCIQSQICRSGLGFQRKHCVEAVETVDVQLITSLCTVFQSLFVPTSKCKLAQERVC